MGWVDPWVGLDRVGLGREFSDSRGLGWVGSASWWVGLGWVQEKEQKIFREYHLLRKCHKMEYNSSSFILFQVQIY